MGILSWATGGGGGGGGGSNSDDSNDNDDNDDSGGDSGGGGLFSGVSSAWDDTTEAASDAVDDAGDAAGDAYDSAAGAADWAAGSTDEAVGRTFDDEEGGGVIDGTQDAFSQGYDFAAGVGDHAAGNIDEAVGRTFDDEEGGGVVDGAQDAYDDAAGALDEWAGDADEKAALSNIADQDQYDGVSAESVIDHALGSTDEAVARTFDDEEGGGVVDGTAETLDAATGATEWANSESGMALKRRMANAGGPLGKFDVATRAGFDFLLDNPRVSVQDITRTGIEKATGSDDLGEDAQNLAEGYSEATSSALEGTAADNPVTDGVVWLADAVVAEPAKAVVTGLTGTDIDKGTNEGTVGAIDAFDIGLTIGTAGAGKAGFSILKGAAKGSDEAATLADDLLGLTGRAGDDAASGADEAASLTDDAPTGGIDSPRQSVVDDAVAASDEGAQTGLEGASVADDLVTRGTDDAASAADEAASVADEAGGVTDDLLSRMQDTRRRLLSRYGDDAASASDDAASATDDAATASDDVARAGDDAASVSDEGASLTDEAARLSDEAAQTGDGLLSRIMPSTRTGKVATAGAGVLGAGALAEQLGTFDRLRVTDPQTGEEYLLIREKSLQPTQEHPDGGTLWSVKSVETQNGEITSQTTQGYTVILSVVGRNVYILGSNGERTKAQASAETFKQAVSRAQGGVA